MGITITGNIVHIVAKHIAYGSITIEGDSIQAITILGPEQPTEPYILPGFIDSHIHIESSMLTPSQFARMAVVHGTVGTVSDPHEIANVCGMQGVEYMITDGARVPFHFAYGAPSCVPATTMETAGATIAVHDVDALLQRSDILYLSEMMNYPGVLHKDADVMAKIELAKKYNKPVDGHAPGLRGAQAKEYIQGIALHATIPNNTTQVTTGTATDHECYTYEEALEKLQYGMKILIREGSAAKNFEALYPLLHNWEDAIMLCSDDKHPDSLELGHINELCARAVAYGICVYKVLKAACINPVLHYKLGVGMLRVGDSANIVMVHNLTQFTVSHTYIKGILVAKEGVSLITASPATIINNFECVPQVAHNFEVQATHYNHTIPVIAALDGQLVTHKLYVEKTQLQNNDLLLANTKIDVLKIVVINRYTHAPIAKAFIKNFGLTKGAIASTVAHDSHNIIAVGVTDDELCTAVNIIIQAKGGLSYAYYNNDQYTTDILPLPIAGIMTNADGYQVSAQYTALDYAVKGILGSTLQSPYMTLSFMALLVIPHLKLSDKGLFDADTFSIM